MKIIHHSPNLTQLTRMIAFNCFFVHESDGLTLVDTGMSGSAPAIMAAAQHIGQPIRRIALTHAHVDHVGSLDALHALLPDAEVSISARDVRFFTGDKSLDADEPQDAVRGGFPLVKTVPHRLLSAGDRVGSLEVITTPGHTPGHVSFLDTRDGTLLAGDAFSTQAGISTAGTFRLLFPFPAMATWHKFTALASAQKLIALNPSRLAVGHGKIIEQPVAAMQSAVDEAQNSIEKRGYATKKEY